MGAQIGKYVKITNSWETGAYGYGSTMMAATVFKPIRVKSISYPVDRSLLIEENIDSFIPTTAYGGALKITGTLEAYLRPKQQEYLFYALMGASAALTASDPITSGFKYTLSAPSSIQMKIGESTSLTASTTALEIGLMGVGIKNCTLNFDSKAIATAKFDWFAKLYTAASPFSPPNAGDYLTEEPIVFYNATVSIGSSATAMTTIKSMTISIDRKVDEDRFIIGDYTLQEIGINGNTEITGDITFTEKEYAMYFAALFGSTTATTLNTENLVSDLPFWVVMTDIAASETKKMYLRFGSIVFGKTDTTLNGNNEVEKKVSFTATGTTFEIGIAA